MMEQVIYRNVVFASFVVMYAYGLFSFVTTSPDGKEYDRYITSRKVFGAIMVMWASFLVIHWHLNLRHNNPLLASTLCFCCFFPGIMLFEMAFSSLITSNYPIRKRVWQIIRNVLCIDIIVFANYFFAPPKIQQVVLIMMAVAFTIEMAFLSIRFIKTYRQALKRADNYYSENIDIFIKWMPNSIYMAMIFGFAGGILFFASNWAVSVYMFGGLLLFTYIFISYQNYMINITKMKDLLLAETQEHPITAENNEDIDNNITDDEMGDKNKEIQRIEKRLAGWVSRKGFAKKGVTIEELAIKFNTNRTYLSSLINNTYNLSFREWVAMHRIEYAKELLLADEELTSNKIAEKVGYSPNAFTNIFTKSVKMTPMQWRSANK